MKLFFKILAVFFLFISFFSFADIPGVIVVFEFSWFVGLILAGLFGYLGWKDFFKGSIPETAA